jgi:hypothetical protein
MIQSGQLISMQLQGIIEDKTNTDKGATEVEEQGEYGEEEHNPAITSLLLNMVCGTINNQY